jgi:CRP/FNR family transcriptional regulator, cyclic AMP receptor protein
MSGKNGGTGDDIRVGGSEARRALGECTLLRGLTEEQRGALVARAQTRTFAPAETIFLMGSPGDCMMMVLSGSVRISVSSADGKELMLAIVRQGEMLGEIALFDRKERTADAVALTECRLAILERREILSFLESHPGALLRLIDMLCSRLRRTNEHIAELALLPLPVRLAKAMLRLATADGDPSVLAIRLSQRELGTMVGATRESINKCLRVWHRCDIIRMGGGAIAIANRAALEELAEPGESCVVDARSREKNRGIPAVTAGARSSRSCGSVATDEKIPLRQPASVMRGMTTGDRRLLERLRLSLV